MPTHAHWRLMAPVSIELYRALEIFAEKALTRRVPELLSLWVAESLSCSWAQLAKTSGHVMKIGTQNNQEPGPRAAEKQNPQTQQQQRQQPSKNTETENWTIQQGPRESFEWPAKQRLRFDFSVTETPRKLTLQIAAIAGSITSAWYLLSGSGNAFTAFRVSHKYSHQTKSTTQMSHWVIGLKMFNQNYTNFVF